MMKTNPVPLTRANFAEMFGMAEFSFQTWTFDFDKTSRLPQDMLVNWSEYW